jgi:hypothetical protein
MLSKLDDPADNPIEVDRQTGTPRNTIFLADRRKKLKDKFPQITCKGKNGNQWMGASLLR